jgi:hypothetical protein
MDKLAMYMYVSDIWLVKALKPEGLSEIEKEHCVVREVDSIFPAGTS